MSTFSGLTRAYTGLSAARQQLDIIGQNITNANTEGYVRQRVNTSSAVAALGAGLMFAGAPRAGAGVNVDSISRLSSNLLDAQVRTTASANGYWTENATNFSKIESSLNEPGTAGLSTGLQAFWTSWQNLSNHAGEAAPTSVMLQAAGQVVSQVSDGYTALSSQWSSVRTDVNATVTDINQAATSLAGLNDQIRQTQAAGGTGNDLTDQRDLLATKLATLVGGTVRDRGDGMVDIVVGGNAIVTGATSRAVVATGAAEMAGAATSPVHLEFTDRPGVAIDGVAGKLGADFSLLGAANASGTGGAIAEAAQGFNDIATKIAAAVNALHSAGATPSGTTGLNFFALDASKPAALGLSVIPTDASGVAAGVVGGGALNGSVADKIAQLATATDGPDTQWSKFVVSIGVQSRASTQQATITQAASATAVTNQASEESVDTDEETTMMLTFQHAYEAAARVMTTVDDMLDTLINKTGLVGR